MEYNEIPFNQIIEFLSGHYKLFMEIDTDESEILKILDKDFKYVWCLKHEENKLEWAVSNMNLYGQSMDRSKVRTRNVSLEYLMDTRYFCDLIKNGQLKNERFTLIQTDIEPPYYLRMDSFNGNSFFNILKEKIDYKLMLDWYDSDIDFVVIYSTDRTLLEDILNKF